MNCSYVFTGVCCCVTYWISSTVHSQKESSFVVEGFAEECSREAKPVCLKTYFSFVARTIALKSVLVKVSIEGKSLMSTKGNYSAKKQENNTISCSYISAVLRGVFPGFQMNASFHASAGNPIMRCSLDDNRWPFFRAAAPSRPLLLNQWFCSG